MSNVAFPDDRRNDTEAAGAETKEQRASHASAGAERAGASTSGDAPDIGLHGHTIAAPSPEVLTNQSSPTERDIEFSKRIFDETIGKFELLIVTATLECLKMLSESAGLVTKLRDNTAYFRKHMSESGYTIRPGIHPIVPVMLGDARLATNIATDMLNEGIYVIGFSYPVVPQGQARIRVQISAAHSRDQLDRAIEAFAKVGKKYGI